MEKKDNSDMFGMFTIPYDKRHGCYVNAGSDYTNMVFKKHDTDIPKTHIKDLSNEKAR